MAFITLLLETIVFLLLLIMYSMAFGEFFLKLFNLSCVLALPILTFINKNRSTLFILIDMLTQFCDTSIIFLFLFSQTCIFIHLLLERVLQLLNLDLALFLFLLAFIDKDIGTIFILVDLGPKICNVVIVLLFLFST
jgi:hypothetical protein